MGYGGVPGREHGCDDGARGRGGGEGTDGRGQGRGGNRKGQVNSPPSTILRAD